MIRWRAHLILRDALSGAATLATWEGRVRHARDIHERARQLRRDCGEAVWVEATLCRGPLRRRLRWAIA